MRPTTEQTAVWVAAGLALFTIVFGTRSLDVNERHPGLVSAIALEAIVKLFAILAVGVFVVWGVADGPSDMLDRIEASPVSDADWNGARWLGLTALSGLRDPVPARACSRCWWWKTPTSGTSRRRPGPFRFTCC